MKLGLHIATASDLVGTPARAKDLGAETIQVFASNPRGWRASLYSDEKASAFRAACTTAEIDPVWIHMIYLVSYGTPDDELREKSIAAMSQTLQVADQLGAAGVVTHMGSHKGLGFAQSLERTTDSFNRVLDSNQNSLLIMENSAGAGGNIGNSLEELSAIFDAMKGHPRLAVCIDTAHAFTSGHDIKSLNGLDNFLADFDRLIGLDRLVVFHLNDTKADIGTRIDRHENIGFGFLGDETFGHIINHPKLAGTSGILEVPGMDGKSGPDKPNLDRLKALRASK